MTLTFDLVKCIDVDFNVNLHRKCSNRYQADNTIIRMQFSEAYCAPEFCSDQFAYCSRDQECGPLQPECYLFLLHSFLLLALTLQVLMKVHVHLTEVPQHSSYSFLFEHLEPGEWHTSLWRLGVARNALAVLAFSCSENHS